MPTYSTQIKKLINQEEQNKSKDSVFISIYHQLNSKMKPDVKKELKARTQSLLRENKNIHDKTKQNILTEIHKQIDSVPSIKKGAAIFVCINTKNQKYTLTVINLERKPVNESYVGRKYDLDQLLFINQTVRESLIVSINLKKAAVFKLKNSSFNKIIDQKNGYVREEDEYVEEFSPLPGEGTVYGTGASKVQKSILRMGREFLNNLQTNIKEKLDNQKQFKYIIIYHSKKLQELIPKFEHELQTYFTRSRTKTIAKNIQNEKQLKKESNSALVNLQQQTIEDVLARLKDNIHIFKTGWDAAAKAAREKNVQRIFTVPTAKREGYIWNRNMPYLEPQNNAQKVNNISPWIIHKVVKSGGDVTVVDDKKLLKGEQVAVELRY